PLMVASVKGNKEIAEKLLNAKADVTKRRKGISALDMARKYGHEDIANLLTAGIKKLSILAKSRRAGR
ncbi:MAG: ankyrin repeat domain-containing protein, partial [Alphaproteobacteria bacterium]|nr:ankyrin repeat domain-containing protein [Alphaproteobacteria bacterium]